MDIHWRIYGNYEINEVICKGIPWLIPFILIYGDYGIFAEGNGI